MTQLEMPGTTPLRELEIIGVRVLGPAPVNDVYFEFSEGFRALYGLNGAGKSRLLNAVSDLLAGRRHGDGYVIVRLNAPEADLARSGPFGSGVRASARRRFGWNTTTLTMFQIISQMLADPNSENDLIPAIAHFAARQGIWMIKPAGDNSGWYAVPGFLADETLQPLLQQHPDVLALLRGSSSAALASRQRLLTHPLLSSGPLAAAAASGNEKDGRREDAAVRRATGRPYPLLAFDHPRAHLLSADLEVAHVLTNRDLTPAEVAEKTIELIGARLAELQEIPLLQAQGEIVSGDLRPEKEESASSRSRQQASEVAKQLSQRATEMLKDALPGEMTAKCTVFDSDSDDLIRWSVSEGQNRDLDLELSELSDAQSRWACLAIAYATSYYRRWQLAEDTEYDALQSGMKMGRREALAEEIASVEREIQDLQRQEFQRELDPDWDEEYDALPDELEDLESQLEELQEDLEDLPPDEIPEAPTEAEIEASLQRQLKEMPISIFLDEPEAGLHRSAERGVVGLLRSIADKRGFPITVATHSPIFLEPAGAEPILLKRSGNGDTELDMGSGVLERTADSLGISRLESFGLYRTILLVEGRHDEIVLREFFKDDLAELRVLVLPMHGGRLIPTAADSFLLADFSEHRVFAMVDNADQGLLNRLLQLAKSTSPVDEEAYLNESKAIVANDKRDEHGFISRLIGRAHSQGLLERFGTIALRRRDILEYLPVEHFVKDAESWDSLNNLHQKKSNQGSFKPWAERTVGADFSDSAIERACRSMDSVPDDLSAVVNSLTPSPRAGEPFLGLHTLGVGESDLYPSEPPSEPTT